MTSYPGVLLVEALLTVAVAPMIGLSIRSLRAQAALLVAFTAFSSVMLSPAAGLTLGAAAFALAAIGTWCRAGCDDTLDAIGLTSIVGGFAGFGVFLLGDFAAEVPTQLLNAALTANPIVATAAAAHIDIFHGSLLYEFSPIAHRDFQYPVWQSAAAIYSCVAVAGFLAAAHARHARAATSAHQLTQRGES